MNPAAAPVITKTQNHDKTINMTYQEAIDYLYAQLPMFSKIGKVAYKNNLTNTLELCAALDNPQRKFKTIHIAGTNGKGSTSHMLAAILQSAGYKTGLYTSPHLKDFRERIKVNGQMCSEAFVINFVEKIQPVVTAVQPSFFEVTVAMAFAYFAEQQTDIAVIETGMGGRLDSTNIISPEVSVITNISMDHMNILGDSLAKIAYSKAGIIKLKTPVVIGEILAETKPVFEEEAAIKDALIIDVPTHYKIKHMHQSLYYLDVTVNANNKEDTYRMDLNGLYQSQNLLTVLATLNVLKEKGWEISVEEIKEGLAHTKKLTGLFGRWELLQENPLIIADVGHNEDGIKQINENLKNAEYENLRIVIGFVKDKDVSAALSLLPKEAVYYFTKADMPRAMDEKDLQQLANGKGFSGNSYPSVQQALQAAKQDAAKEDMILICGSVFIVAEI